MNPLTPLRMTVLCLISLTLPVSATAQDQAPATQPGAATQPDTATQADAATQPEEAAQESYHAGMPPAASKEDVSFSIGYTIGADMAQRGVEIDADELAQGIRAGLGVNESRLTPEQIQQCLFSFQMQMQQQQFAQAKGNFDAGLAYLNQNSTQEGVTVTESGLQYRVIASGDGATPSIDDEVAARYRGTLIDGTEFDSSPGEEAVAFPVNRVIPGWVEALQMMKVGDKWELVIPSELAYGEGGAPQGNIGPNEVLIFEIELVEIK